MQNVIYMELSPKGENIMRESFRVSSSAKRIHISVKRPAGFDGMGFLAVFDEEKKLRLQKMLGYGEQELCIGERAEETSIGAVAGAIGEGEWKIVYGSFFHDWENYEGACPLKIEIAITDEKKKITEQMEELWMTNQDDFHMNKSLYNWEKIYNKKTAWFKGDFHTHTRLSDGKETVENAMKKAVDMQMDFYVPTEHNVVHTGWKKTELLIVPGVEVTLPLGHYNLFGITERPKQLDVIVQTDDKEEMAKQMLSIIEDANQKNWVTSINHPFLHVWKWHLDEVELSKIQCLEIINDPTYQYATESNDKAIAFLDVLWQGGHKIYGVGGSDAHNLIDERYEGATEPSIAGDPGTYVYCSGLSAANLLKAVKEGHMVVTRHCEIVPYIYSDTKTYLPGDEIEDRRITYELEISGITDYPKVYLVGNTDTDEIVKAPVQVVKKGNGAYFVQQKIKAKAGQWKWMRMEVRDAQGKFLGYVNPVYSGRKEPEYKTYGEAKDAWLQGESDD